MVGCPAITVQPPAVFVSQRREGLVEQMHLRRFLDIDHINYEISEQCTDLCEYTALRKSPHDVEAVGQNLTAFE